MSVVQVLSDQKRVSEVLYGFTGSVSLTYFFIPELLDRKAPIPSYHRITLSLQVSVCSLCCRAQPVHVGGLGFRLTLLKGGKARTKLVWALLCPEQLFFKHCMWETHFLWGKSFPVCLCSLMLTLQLLITAKHPVPWSVTQKLEALYFAWQDRPNHFSASDGTTISPLQLALNHQYSLSCFQEWNRSCA